MKNLVDRFLNQITMYRLVRWYLVLLLALAAGLSFLGALPYSGWAVIGSAVWLVGVCWLINALFAKTFGAPVHRDSATITALILALIISPFRSVADLPLLLWAPILAMAGKYIIAIRRQHIFNPAALAVAITAFTIHQSASWWVGNKPLLPAVLIGGFLIVRKLRRADVVLAFTTVALLTILSLGLARGTPLATTAQNALVSFPLFFFAFVMLTEPMTLPPTKRWRVWYGVCVGLLFAPQIHLGKLFSTPELALLVGNLIFFLIIRRGRSILRLVRKEQVAPNIIDFIFRSDRQIPFRAGQFLEWGLAHSRADSRGQRRYFTVASSPTEADVRLGVKFYNPSSSYKRALSALKPGQAIVAAQLDGDFILPRNPRQPCVFIAGGIGVTPFRSMLQFLIDVHQPRPITLLYANQKIHDVVYQDVFQRAQAELGIRTVYVLTDETPVPVGWKGQRGQITPELIKREVPHYRQAQFYLSGPEAMVNHYLHVLRRMRIPRKCLKTDYFPGFA